MTKPLVSVIIPVFNGEKYIAQAIESIFNQEYRSFEVIVVDDDSTDGSAGIAKSYGTPVQYYYQTNSGLAAALNQGVVLAKGTFFSFLDTDDIWNKLGSDLEDGICLASWSISLIMCSNGMALENTIRRCNLSRYSDNLFNFGFSYFLTPILSFCKGIVWAD